MRLENLEEMFLFQEKEVFEKSNAEIKEALKNIKEGDVIENAIVKAIPDGKWGAFLDLGNNCTAYFINLILAIIVYQVLLIF